MPVDGERERRGGMTEDRLHRLGGRSPLEGSTSGSRKHSRQRSSSVSGGRLELQGVDTRSITARCRGDSGELYKLGYYEEGGWYCTCLARSRCSHLTALMLCVLKPGTKGLLIVRRGIDSPHYVSNKPSQGGCADGSRPHRMQRLKRVWAVSKEE